MKCGSKKKVKKFAAGGYPAFTSVSSLDEKGELKPEFGGKTEAPKQSFGEAFKAARKAGDTNFTWNGKSYNTKLKEEVKPKMENVTVTASRLTHKNDRSPRVRPGPSAGVALAMARELNKTSSLYSGRKYSPYQDALDRANKSLERGTPSMRSYAKGGSIRGDGCASKGKTKGRMC